MFDETRRVDFEMKLERALNRTDPKQGNWSVFAEGEDVYVKRILKTGNKSFLFACTEDCFIDRDNNGIILREDPMDWFHLTEYLINKE